MHKLRSALGAPSMNCFAQALLYQICNEVGRPPSGMVSIARIENSNNKVLREEEWEKAIMCNSKRKRDTILPLYAVHK